VRGATRSKDDASEISDAIGQDCQIDGTYHFGQIDGNVDVVVSETPVLLGVEHFQHGCTWVAVEIGPADLVNFVCANRDPVSHKLAQRHSR